MKTLIIAGLIFASNSWAGVIKLATKIESRDGVTASPSLKVKESEWASVTQDKVTLKVKAVLKGKDNVKIAAEIFEPGMLKSDETPKVEIVARRNEAGTAEVSDENGKLAYRLTVTPDWE